MPNPQTLREQAEALQNEIGKSSNLCTPACEKCAANDAEQLAAILAFAQAVQEDTREACAKEVPTTWLHPFLSGKDRVISEHDISNADIENLCKAIARAIRAQQGLK